MAQQRLDAFRDSLRLDTDLLLYRATRKELAGFIVPPGQEVLIPVVPCEQEVSPDGF